MNSISRGSGGRQNIQPVPAGALDGEYRNQLAGGDDPSCAALPLLKVYMAPTVGSALSRTLYSGYIGEGPRVREFEAQLACWLGNRHVLALNSGTSSLHLALHLANVRAGDEVISTPMTCMATNAAIAASGARIVWADIDPCSGNIAPEWIRRKLTPKTRAIMVMHWGGYPCDLQAIGSIAAEAGVPVIEDACHAFGASYDGRPIGSHSDFVCFSFQAVKVLTTGDGGALLCRSRETMERGRLLRWYGLDRRLTDRERFLEQDIDEIGYKFHMNDLAATIGLEQLRHVADNLARARTNADRYNDAFRALRYLHRLDVNDPRCEGSHWLYTLRVPRRRSFIEKMHRAGIAASPVHRRNDTYTVFREFAAHLPGVSAFDKEHVCIPVGWWVDDDAVQRVIRTVLEFDDSCGAKSRRSCVSVG
jgi:perosamine synthetase